LILNGGKSGDQFANASIYNNTICLIRTDRPGGGVGINISAFARNTELSNNLVYECAGAALSAGEGSLGRHDHNLFFSSQGGILVLHGRNRYTAANLKSFEPHSLAADPRLINIGQPLAFHMPTGGVSPSRTLRGTRRSGRPAR